MDASVLNPSPAHCGRVVALVLCAALAAGCTPEKKEADDANDGINISRFVFRDLDRNGRYDLGERPYAGLDVELSGPGRTPVRRSSNIAGFANFRMALGNTDRDINAAGALTFAAIAPPGWAITTSEKQADTMAIERPGSPGGLVVDPLLPLIGVAPELSISGRAEAGARIRLVGPDGKTGEVTADADGRFSAPSTPGVWTVDWTPDNGAEDVRRIAVGQWAVFAARPLAAQPEARARAAVADFDALTPSDTLFEIPDGYAGVGWRNWVATHQKLYRGEGYINAAVSGEYVAYNSSGHPAKIHADKPFDFVGAFIGVAWPQGAKADIVVSAWRGEEKIAEERLRGRSEGAQWFDADWRGVTRVEFSHDNYWQIVLDDVTLRVD